MCLLGASFSAVLIKSNLFALKCIVNRASGNNALPRFLEEKSTDTQATSVCIILQATCVSPRANLVARALAIIKDAGGWCRD